MSWNHTCFIRVDIYWVSVQFFLFPVLLYHLRSLLPYVFAKQYIIKLYIMRSRANYNVTQMICTLSMRDKEKWEVICIAEWHSKPITHSSQFIIATMFRQCPIKTKTCLDNHLQYTIPPLKYIFWPLAMYCIIFSVIQSPYSGKLLHDATGRCCNHH